MREQRQLKLKSSFFHVGAQVHDEFFIQMEGVEK